MTDHKQAAEAFVDAIRGSGNADLMWENDEGRQVPLEYAVAAALARVERETIERCAKVVESRPGADAYADDNRPCGPCCDLNAAAIRALSGGAK